MIQEGFTFYRPNEALKEYVRFYWVFRSSLAMSALTFPTGCPQIIFHRRKPLYIPELDTFQSRLTISGQTPAMLLKTTSIHSDLFSNPV